MQKDKDIQAAIEQIRQDHPNGITLIDVDRYGLRELLDELITQVSPHLRSHYRQEIQDGIFADAFSMISEYEKSKSDPTKLFASILFGIHVLSAVWTPNV